MKVINNFSNIFKVFFIFVCLLYAWIPFEAGNFNESFRIHMFFLVLLILYTLYITSFKLNKYGVSFFIFFLFISSCLFFVSYGQAIYSFMPSLAFAGIIGPAIYNNNDFKKHFMQALLLLIIVSIAMVFLQVLVYIITGNVLLLHEFVFPFSQARVAIELQFNQLTRMGGMYIEPGTYSNYIFILLTIYSLLQKRVNYILVFFIAISMILTYSLWGMIFAIYLLVLIFFIKLFTASLKVKALLILACFFISFYAIGNIDNIIRSNAVQYGIEKMSRNAGQDSTGAKKIAYEIAKNTYDDFFLVGYGFAPKLRNEVTSLQDAGLLLNFSIVFGILPTIILLLMYIFFFLKLTNYIVVLISLPIFMSKIFYWDPALWLLFFMIFYGYIKINDKKNDKIKILNKF